MSELSTAIPTGSDSKSSDELLLSVVVVTYNEAGRIRNCLDSIFATCGDVTQFEVIVVDSNSTDRTREIAANYPVTVLCISDDSVTTPGAGRYVGTIAARGEMILFVDGDMELEPDWLPPAIEHLQRTEDVAAVDGLLNGGRNEDTTESDVIAVGSVRGVALYDVDPLETVGGFNPHLRSLEDIHLGQQLTLTGYELHRLPRVAAHHPESDPLQEGMRRWNRGYMAGPGQIIRYASSSPRLLGKYLFRFRYRFLMFVWLCLGFASLLSMPVLIAWTIFSVVGTGYLVSRLGVSDSVEFLCDKVIGIFGLAQGLMIPPKPREAFSMDSVICIQTGPVHDTTEEGAERHPSALR